MTKGELSTPLTALMDPPHLRFCRACNATHLYEMPFRLAAQRAGLELGRRHLAFGAQTGSGLQAGDPEADRRPLASTAGQGVRN